MNRKFFVVDIDNEDDDTNVLARVSITVDVDKDKPTNLVAIRDIEAAIEEALENLDGGYVVSKLGADAIRLMRV